MYNEFKSFINDLLTYELVIFTSSSFYEMDNFSKLLRELLPHQYYYADDFKMLKSILQSTPNDNNEKVCIIDLLSKGSGMVRLNYLPLKKTIFIFIPTYKSIMNKNLLYTLPKELMYNACAVFNIENNKLHCLKNRYSDPTNVISYEIKTLLRLSKIKKLLR